MEKLDFSRKSLKSFGMTMGAAFLVVSSLLYFRHKYTPAAVVSAVSFVFFAAGLFLPVFLKPVYVVWMRFASVLGWINTRIILAVMFYAVLIPIGLLMRLFGTDPLERNKTQDTYWKDKKAEFDLLNYERRF